MQDNDLPQIGTPMQTDETRAQIGRHLATFNLFREADHSLQITIAEAKGVQAELGGSGAPLALCAMNALYSAVDSRRGKSAFAATPAVEREGCPFCGSMEIGWTMLAGHKFAASYCQACNARGPAVPFEMKREPIDETTAPAKEAWAKRFGGTDEFRNVLRVFIEAHQSPEPYVSYEMDMPVPNDRRDEQFAIDVALLDKTYALSPTLHPSDREAIAEALWNVGERDRYNMSWERAKAENHNWVVGCYMHTDAILALSGSLAPANPTERDPA